RHLPSDDPLGADPEVALFELGDDPSLGILGYPAHQPGGSHIYFASGTAPVVFKLDMATMSWERGARDPIRLYDSRGNALHDARMGPNGVLFVTAFNRDELYLVDTNCDARLGDPVLLDDSEFLAGPHGVVPVTTESGVDAWVGMSLANELTRVNFRFDER
ncbi:MAG: hypothetical protein R3224_07565, partial [Balneolaceae bacterium]|nr:hypothetical protein [Balneolaceae bacterium]